MAAKFINEPALFARFSNVATEPQQPLQPIQGYEDKPLVSLEKATEPLDSLVPQIKHMTSTVKQICCEPIDGLTKDESTSIYLYSMEWEPSNQSFSFILNTTLQKASRGLLKPWFLYLRLIMTALAKLPSQPARCTVYRGVKMDLSKQYHQGKIVTWWSFSSCTVSIDVLQNERFLGQNGIRTMFVIDCFSGKDICRHTFYPDEKEILLPPACQFEVIGCLNRGNGLHVVQLKEIKPEPPLMNPIQLPITSSPKVIPDVSKMTTRPITSLSTQAAPRFTSSDTILPMSIPAQQPTALSKKPTLPPIIPANKPVLQPTASPTKSVLQPTVSKAESEQQCIVPLTKPKQRPTALSTKPHTLAPLNQPLQPTVPVIKRKPAVSTPTSPLTAETMSTCDDHKSPEQRKTLHIDPGCTNLDLRDRLIRDRGAEDIANDLIRNQTLITISLWYNEISDHGAACLANSLKYNNTLTALRLSYNEIGPQGAKHIANGLQVNKTLAILYLNYNKIGDQGVQYLANTLQDNKTLITLHLCRNQIGQEGAKHLAKALENNKGLTTLSLADNQIEQIGAQHIAHAFSKNTTLTTLNLNNNQVGTIGGQHLARILRNYSTLTNLNLCGNQIDRETEKDFKEIMKNKPLLKVSF